MRWMAKLASSLQLISAKMGSMLLLAPTMADASSTTQRFPAVLILSDNASFHRDVIILTNCVFSVSAFISVSSTTLKSM